MVIGPDAGMQRPTAKVSHAYSKVGGSNTPSQPMKPLPKCSGVPLLQKLSIPDCEAIRGIIGGVSGSASVFSENNETSPTLATASSGVPYNSLVPIADSMMAMGALLPKPVLWQPHK